MNSDTTTPKVLKPPLKAHQLVRPKTASVQLHWYSLSLTPYLIKRAVRAKQDLWENVKLKATADAQTGAAKLVPI